MIHSPFTAPNPLLTPLYPDRLNFAAGFFGVRTYQEDYNQLIIIENANFNNTLAPYDSCNNSNVESIGDIGDAYVAQWESIYLKDAAKRLNGLIEGVNITTSFAYDMQELCAYEVSFPSSFVPCCDGLDGLIVFVDRCARLLLVLRALH